MRSFTCQNLEELREEAEACGARHVRFEQDPERVRSVLGRKVSIGKWVAGNSLAIHPMEGCDGSPEGLPGELTWRRYERFAAGGAKLIWFEATAVRPEARANTRQLLLNDANAGEFARLIEHIRKTHEASFGSADDLITPLQLAHSGRYSVPRPVVASHYPPVDAKTRIPHDYPLVTDDELERLEDDYLAAARLAYRAGFGAVDVKATHGYLLSELLSARQREGRYGGSLENRTRFIRNVLGKIRAEFGEKLLLCMRLGCYDGLPYERDPETGVGRPLAHGIPYSYGFGMDASQPLVEDLSEVLQAVGWFRDAGVQLLNVSLGSPYLNPHIGRPFEKPDEGNYEQPEHPLHGVDRHFRIAGALQRAYPDLPMVGTGYSWLQIYCIHAGARNIEDGAIRFVGIGRGALAYPDFARDALEVGALDPLRVCKTLTYCTFLMRQKNHPLGQFPTGCPPFDKDVYGPIMKEARAALRRTQGR